MIEPEFTSPHPIITKEQLNRLRAADHQQRVVMLLQLKGLGRITHRRIMEELGMGS